MNFANVVGPRGNQNFGYQAAAPQYASSTSMRQYANPTPMPQYQNRAPVPQYNNRGPMPQYGNRSPMPQYENRGHPMPQYENRGPMPRYENTGPMPQYEIRGPAPQYENRGPMPQYETRGPMPPQFVNRPSMPSQFANVSSMPPQYTSSQRMYANPTTLPPQYASTKAMPQPQFQTQYPPQYAQQPAPIHAQQYAVQYAQQYPPQSKFASSFAQPSPMSQPPQFEYAAASPQYQQDFALSSGLVSTLPTAEEYLQDQGMTGSEPNEHALLMQQMQNVQRVQDEFDYKKRQEDLQKQLNMPSYADLMNNSYNDYMTRQQLFKKHNDRSAQLFQGMFSQAANPSALRSFTPEQYARMVQQQMPRDQQKPNSRQMIVPYSPTGKIATMPSFTSGGISYGY